jgi:hypothetical protein
MRLAEILLDEFAISDDSELLVDLSYIFVQVCLGTNNLRLQAELRDLLLRAEQLNPRNYEFAVYLNEFKGNME